MFALGLIMPILPKLVESFVDNDTASAARIFGLFGTAWALMQFFFSPILGALVGPFRPPAGGAAVEFRLGARLRADGAGAVADLAVRRPGDFRHHLGEHLDRIRLHRRRHAAGTARRGVRQDRRGVRRRLHSRTRARRPARRHRSAAAVLGRGGLELCQYAVWLADPAGIAAAGSALAVSLEERQSRSARCSCWAPIRTLARPVGGRLSSPSWRMWCCRPPSCSTRPIAMAGMPRRSV